ncbi:multiple organellar RNA editing factor 3, mitochondrial-like [Rutidosis leptorrhynchoides]|uniref:multiple organellar RNA editing factor 3, mitochondrial-like n=1 Tax=Rutidosis leptorrhynchoides TaxID=125765 RepID=UPI003A99B0B3
MAIYTTRRTLSSIFSRILSSSSSSTSISSRSRFALPLLDHNYQSPLQIPHRISVRLKTSGSGYSPLNDPSPNWSNRPPKETILLDGCDYEHWLIVMEFPTDPKPSEDEMINSYVKTLANVLESEEEAKKKIYSVSTTTYTGFGALISEELSYKLKGLPGVLWVLPDSYLDVPNKDYGGDLFIDGKVIPRPQYRFTDRQQNTRPRPRPRYDKRRETMQTIRREPIQRDGWTQDQRNNIAQPTGQIPAQNAYGGFPQNQGGSRESSS